MADLERARPRLILGKKKNAEGRKAFANYHTLQFTTKFSPILIGLNSSRDAIVFIRGKTLSIIIHITKSMRALWLVNQLCFIVPVNPWKNRASFELLYKSNRPQVSVVYRLINHLGCWYNTRRIRKSLACARDLQILLVFYQHPACLSAYKP